jgi:hypothetical protein
MAIPASGFTWQAPAFSFGWILALVILLVTLIFWGMGLVSKEVALPTCAICSVRL